MRPAAFAPAPVTEGSPVDDRSAVRPLPRLVGRIGPGGRVRVTLDPRPIEEKAR